LTQDPLGEVDSVNLYAFNRFDSVNFVDPFGLQGGKSAAGGGSIDDCAAGRGNCPEVTPNPPTGGSSASPVGQPVEPKSEPRPLENTSQVVAGVSVGTGATGPRAGPPGPPEPPPSGDWGRFPKNQPKPPGGFNRGVQAAGETEKVVEPLVKKAGPRLGVRTAARVLGVVGIAVTAMEVLDYVKEQSDEQLRRFGPFSTALLFAA